MHSVYTTLIVSYSYYAFIAFGLESAISTESAILISSATFHWLPMAMPVLNNTTNKVNSTSFKGSTPTVVSGSRGNLKDVNIEIKKGELVAVIGPVGSGKSNLLSAVLGDMHKRLDAGRVAVSGEVAYVPQTAWIPNDSLRNVVLFGKPYDEARYRRALRVCSLEKDLQMLDAGDLTEIGEKGTNLSGGQKQRLSIARAVYEDADIYLLDDPLSALDAEVGSKLFNECIKEALHGKTRVLVTHQLSVLPYVDCVVVMQQNEEGECAIVAQGSLDELLRQGYDLSKLVKTEEVELNEDEKEIVMLSSRREISVKDINMKQALPPSAPVSNSTSEANLSTLPDMTTPEITYTNEDGDAKLPVKLMTAETDSGRGAVKWEVYAKYLKAAKSPVLLGVILASFLLSNACQILQQWIVGAWTSDVGYTRRPLHAYLSAVAAMALGVAFFTWLRSYMGTLFGAMSSETLHNDMVLKVLSAPLNYFGKLTSSSYTLSHTPHLIVIILTPREHADRSPCAKVLQRHGSDGSATV